MDSASDIFRLTNAATPREAHAQEERTWTEHDRTRVWRKHGKSGMRQGSSAACGNAVVLTVSGPMACELGTSGCAVQDMVQLLIIIIVFLETGTLWECTFSICLKIF